MAHSCQRILVIEDDADLRRMIGELVSEEGIEPMLAPTAAEAFRLLEQGLLPDVILLDLTLPDATGAMVLERLKADPRWKHIPVAAMSGFERRRYAYLDRANDFLAKPFDLERLASALDRLCAQAAARA